MAWALSAHMLHYDLEGCHSHNQADLPYSRKGNAAAPVVPATQADHLDTWAAVDHSAGSLVGASAAVVGVLQTEGRAPFREDLLVPCLGRDLSCWY